MKIYYAQHLLKDWDENINGNVIVTESITFEIGGFVYEVGCGDEDETPNNIWFSRRRVEDHNLIDSHEIPERWVPEQGSDGFEEYDKLKRIKEFKLF